MERILPIVSANCYSFFAIRHQYNITPRHVLWDYCSDANGYHPGEPRFSPENGTYLDYFVFNGRRWPTEQFLSTGSAWAYPIMFEDENGKLNYISGYDRDDYRNPLLIEIGDGGEAVRCYYEEESAILHLMNI